MLSPMRSSRLAAALAAFPHRIAPCRPLFLSSTYHAKLLQAHPPPRSLETRRHLRLDHSQLPNENLHATDSSSPKPPPPQSPSPSPEAQGQGQQQEPKRRVRLGRKGRRTLWVLGFVWLGWFSGKTAAEDVYGYNVVEQGSEEDQERINKLERGIEDWVFLRNLRRDEQWTELSDDGDFGKPAFGVALKGSGGICAERVFWNPQTKTAVSVFHIGKLLNGWPGVIHGGLQATLHEESMTRVAHLASGGRPSKHSVYNSVTGGSLLKHQLVIDYRKLAIHDQFIFVVAQVDQERSTKDQIYTTAKLCNQMEMLCSESEARFDPVG